MLTCISDCIWINYFKITIFYPYMNIAPNYPRNQLNKCQLFAFQLFLPITAGSDLMQLENNTDNHYSLQSVK